MITASAIRITASLPAQAGLLFQQHHNNRTRMDITKYIIYTITITHSACVLQASKSIPLHEALVDEIFAENGMRLSMSEYTFA